MKQNLKRKVCLIVDCLSVGGAERAAARLSIKLAEQNYDVSIISIRDKITYVFKGNLYNLGINKSRLKLKKQFYKFLAFRKAYKKIDADVYIDFRMRNRFFMEWLLHVLVFDLKKMIMTVHHFNIAYHIPKGNFFKNEYSKVKSIVGVSKEVVKTLNNYHAFGNVKYIPNFINKELLISTYNANQEIPENAILAIGRLNNEVKQFDKLILSFKNTKAFKEGIPLVILGDGKDKEKLKQLIELNKLEDSVHLLGFVNNPYDYMKRCKFLVLCSKFEGMPLVILETLAMGRPVVSFNCKSGPSEMIIDGENGILVEDQNFNAFREAIDKMIDDTTFYEYCKTNTLNSVSKFSEEHVVQTWIELIEN